jgi:hypothetical protein
MFRRRFEPSIFRIQVKSVTAMPPRSVGGYRKFKNLQGIHPVVLAYINSLFNRHNTTPLNLVHINCA